MPQLDDGEQVEVQGAGTGRYELSGQRIDAALPAVPKGVR